MGGKPQRVSENEGEDTSHDWKAWETVTRSSGKPWDWSPGSEHSEFQAGYEGGGICPCGKVDPSGGGGEKKKPAGRVEAGIAEALDPNDRKREKNYQGATQDERPQGGSACSGWRTDNRKEANTEPRKIKTLQAQPTE
jgi:hypothetical protein